MRTQILTSRRSLLILSAIVIAGLVFRVLNLMHGFGSHPDERHIMMTTERLRLSDMNPRFFAYGSLPFYLLWGIAQCFAYFSEWMRHYDGLFYIGRGLAAVIGALAVVMTYTTAQRLWHDRRVALVAAFLLSFNVFHLQLSRFYTVDILLTTLTLVFLNLCIRISRGGMMKNFIFAGIVLGMAFATKISALTLLLPLGIAVAATSLSQRRWMPWVGLAVCIVVAAAMFCVCEPYAILDFATFVRSNQEQIQMVAGKTRPPYTIQYENTEAYLYPLLQMWRFTMGWPVALAVALGLVMAVSRQMKRFHADEFLLLAWIVAVFFSTAGLQVKFPRYLLPLYPILFLFAGLFLIRSAEWLGRIRRLKFWSAVPLVAVLLFSMLYAVAFRRIYSVDHTYELASRWIYSHVPDGSRIVGVHWDDKLPLSLPGLSAHRYLFEGDENELPLYERDDAAKLQIVAARASRADYIVFPTQRLPGSILRVPDEFPQTTSFLEFLFSERLGFRLIHSVKIRPSFGSFTLFDDIADESFSVYDHPKVWIFKNVERLNADELARRISEGAKVPAPLTWKELMLKDAAGSDALMGEVSSFGSIVAWLAVLMILGAIGVSVASVLMADFPDRGSGIAPAIGLVSAGYLCWLLQSLHVVTSSPAAAWFVVIVLALGAILVAARYRDLLARAIPQLRASVVLFLSVFLLVCIFRSLQPEIFWGEKPMDFSFLNYFIRAESLPPHDPWAAGHVMSYYYFGSYLFAFLHKLSGVESGIGYNLSIATIAALLATGLASVIYWLSGRRWLSIVGALAIVLCSNLEWIQLLIAKHPLNFDFYWSTTRLLTEPQISEYPLWSILFADLHAHVISLPFVVLFLALSHGLLEMPSRPLTGRFIATRVACSVVLGILMMLNTWDFLTGSLFVALLLAIRTIAVHLRGWWRRTSLSLGQLLMLIGVSLAEFAAIVAGALILIAPFLLQSLSGSRAEWGWVARDEFNSLLKIVSHLGLWVLPLLFALGIRASKHFFERRFSAGVVGYSCAAAAIPLLLGVVTFIRGTRGVPWAILALSSLLILGAGLFALMARRLTTAIYIGALVSSGALLISLTEIFFLMDRMNTSFKTYNFIWLTLGMSAVALTPILFGRLKAAALPQSAREVVASRGGAVLVGALVLLGVIGGALDVGIMTTFQRIESPPRPTLDGTAYIEASDPQDAELYRWLNSHISGTPVIVEAQGDSYREFSRVSMFTGLPTVLGWEHHVVQRGLDREELFRRKIDIQEIYSTLDGARAMDLLQRYGAELVIVADLERRTYTAEGLKKFEQRADLFVPIFKNTSATVYALKSSALARRFLNSQQS